MALHQIKTRILRAEEVHGRDLGSTRLIAVSKVQPIARIKAVLEQGHRCFGENRVQEAIGKWPKLQKSYENIELHLIGPLQTNKTRQAMKLFNAIHSVDRSKLSSTIARLAQELGSCPVIFIQVNTGNEPQKTGILPNEVDVFIKSCRALDLPVKGVMCIPPVKDDASRHFELLASIAEKNGLPFLSMGMSADFEMAVGHGATHVRVGSAIFGERDPDAIQ